MHAVRRGLLAAQAAAAGLPLHVVEIPSPCPNEVYEAAMACAMADAQARGVQGVAFGDLFLEDIRRYREERLRGTGLEPLFPLWGRPTRELAEEMIDGGLRARLTCVDPRALPAAFAGREFDRALLNDLPSGVDPCGENGEFHSFAYAGPMFRAALPVVGGETVTRDGFVFADLLHGDGATETRRHGDTATTVATAASSPRPARGRVRARRGAASLLAVVLALALALPALAAKPQRVASANLSSDEILVEILPLARLVSVTRWVDEASMSNAVGRVPASVFRVQKADLESLVALAPDLVVVSEYTDADFQRLLERSGMRVHRMSGLDTLAGVRRAIVDLGRAVGEEAAAAALAERYDARLRELAGRLQRAPRPRVLYWSGGMTAGANTAIGALIEAAGAVNVGRELGVEGIAPPGAERAFVADPDILLVSTWPGADTAVSQHPLLSQSRAVRSGRVLRLENRLLVALSQYSADAAWELARLLHPGIVKEPAP
jgi:ABC-type Fe3+-hydroxamate transport system substrate-binding protein/diphthamide synthase (EF-2-diphthine--ammonia ligase)